MVVDCREYDAARLGRKLEQAEIRRLQLDLLDALRAFCDQNGLTYYLSGGTLLGAVRHRGYIPWDDDIDVNMPRPDVDRLIAMTGGRLNDHMEIASPEGPIEHATPFPRLCDTRYVIRSDTRDGKARYYTNLFIDIFPIEGLPSAPWRMRLHYLHTRPLITMRRLAYFEGPLTGRNIPLKLLRYMLRPLARRMGYKHWNLRLNAIARKYAYDACDYVGVVTGQVHTTQEYIEKAGYGAPVPVEFEGKRYNGPADADKYLTNLYGDYMKLPPADRQIAHLFDVWEIQEDRK